jgi:hypothetical protein
LLSLLASTLTAQQPFPFLGADDVFLRIQIDRPTYHVGDSILVRVTVRNVSGHTLVSYPPLSWTVPVYVAPMQVYDSGGHEVTPKYPPWQPFSFRSLKPDSLKDGEELTLFLGTQWLNLRRFWGYDLPTPGRYSIQTPAPNAIIGKPNTWGAPPDETVWSKKATFTIEP